MTLTANDQYRGVVRISREQFSRLLRERANPAVIAERDPGEYWDAIKARDCDPLYILAMFGKESTWGKFGVAVTSKSWGNTRAPSFGATPTGDMPGRTGRFPTWATWLDGCISTVARLMTPDWYYTGEERTIGEVNMDPHWDHANNRFRRNPDKPIRPPNPRTTPIEWAPAGDLNSPSGYLNWMLTFMNEHQDMEERVSRTLRIALAAGHRNSDGGNAIERELVAEHCFHAVQAFRAAGADVRSITPNDGRGTFPGGLQAVAQRVVDWHNQGWTADLFLEFHTQGVNNSSVRGAFTIYPDWGNDVDVAVRDRLGPDMAKRVAASMGIPVWRNGIMSERETGVGGKGHRLGVFLRTAPIRAHTTRMLLESGAHTSPADLAVLRRPETPAKIAKDVVEAVYHHFGRTVPDEKPKSDPNARHFEQTGHWMINANTEDGRVEMLTHFEREGGVGRCGLPIAGMTREIRSVGKGDVPVYVQLCENVELQCWINGWDGKSSPIYRFGDIGRELRNTRLRIAELEAKLDGDLECDCS